MAKRANGEGTVARPANGTWEAKLTYADPATGQRRRVSFYGPTARRPGVKRGEARHLDGDAVTAVLRASEVSRYHPVLVLIASTGLRKGEALALRLDKVDLEAGVLRVAATIARVDGRLVISGSGYAWPMSS